MVVAPRRMLDNLVPIPDTEFLPFYHMVLMLASVCMCMCMYQDRVYVCVCVHACGPEIVHQIIQYKPNHTGFLLFPTALMGRFSQQRSKPARESTWSLLHGYGGGKQDLCDDVLCASTSPWSNTSHQVKYWSPKEMAFTPRPFPRQISVCDNSLVKY